MGRVQPLTDRPRPGDYCRMFSVPTVIFFTAFGTYKTEKKFLEYFLATALAQGFPAANTHNGKYSGVCQWASAYLLQ